MDRDRRLSVVVGGFVLVALALLAVAVLSLSSQHGIFTPRYRLVAYYANVGGLVAGAEVRLAGTRVGRVESVNLATRADGQPAVRVVLQLDRAVSERVRADSEAAIATAGLLGDQIVEISMGTDAAAPLPDGAEIHTLSPFDLGVMIARGSEALDSIRNLARNLDEVVREFREGMGQRRIAQTFGALSEIVEEARHGQGALHSLIFERYEGTAVQNLEASMSSLASILSEIQHGQGVLHALVYEKPSEQDVVLQILEAGAKLNTILGRIERGDGTLGLLLNDPTLYEELKQLVGGANRSTLVRSVVNLVSPSERQ
jgi:phospholipid/cholesterol/gamma-HCH transport system substrate-binding protein